MHEPMRWTRQGLLLAPAGGTDWATHAQVPTVLALSERLWRVYFAGRDVANRSHIHRADVDPGDGMRLLHVETRPLLPDGEPGAFDADGMGPASALRVGDQVWLYYTGVARRADVPHQIAVGLAVSDDGGRHFRRACAGPVLGPGPHDPFFASTPYVWRVGSQFRALYNSGTRWLRHGAGWENLYELRLAVSDDGLHWAARPDAALGLAGSEAGLARPCVLPDGDGWRMWFCHRGLDDYRHPEGEAYRLQAARSHDGEGWTREATDLVWSNPPRAGDWDGWMQAYPWVLPRGDELVMFYNGNDFGRGGFGWARAPRGRVGAP
jgi:hypothetical protein